MENFVLLEGTDTLKDSRELLNNALLTVRSLSSGTAFPTDNLSAGMLCYRTDLKKMYQYKEDGSWTTDVSMSISGNANTANSAGTATTAERANTANNADTATTAGTCTGNSATATKLLTPRTINAVSFDGSKNIEIPVGVITVNGIEPDTSGDVTIAGMPIGTVIALAGSDAPNGYLICNGGAVSRTTYADLFAAIGTTYGEGDGSTTFALPNLTDRFIMGSGTAGTVKAAGLPNITGTFDSAGFARSDSFTVTGAFSPTGAGAKTGGYLAATSAKLSFNASKSNAIYGKSTTVQPPAVTMRFYIKY